MSPYATIFSTAGQKRRLILPVIGGQTGKYPDETVGDPGHQPFPQGLAVIWEMIKSNIPDYDKADFLLDADAVLGLNLANVKTEIIPEEIIEKMELRRRE